MLKTPDWNREPHAAIWLMTALVGLGMWLRAHGLAEQAGVPFDAALDAAAQEAILFVLGLVVAGWGFFLAGEALARRRARRQAARQHEAEGA